MGTAETVALAKQRGKSELLELLPAREGSISAIASDRALHAARKAYEDQDDELEPLLADE